MDYSSGRWGGRPKTSADNSDFLRSEGLAEVSCLLARIRINAFLGRPNSRINNDAYKLKVEKSGTNVLGRSGGIKGLVYIETLEHLVSKSSENFGFCGGVEIVTIAECTVANSSDGWWYGDRGQTETISECIATNSSDTWRYGD